MEKLITKITDNDFGLKFCDMEKPQLRKGARGIVIREDGKIAIFNKANKHEYKLPGGGIEENENPENEILNKYLDYIEFCSDVFKINNLSQNYRRNYQIEELNIWYLIFLYKKLLMKKVTLITMFQINH